MSDLMGYESTAMPPHQQRVINEKRELDDRTENIYDRRK